MIPLMGPGVTNTPHTNCTENQSGILKSCAGCDTGITDRFMLQAMDRYWHVDCLKCSSCKILLSDIGASCFTKGGMVLCRKDYLRLFGSNGSCCGCGQSIPASEFVMRAQNKVYHLKCFTCCACHIPLITGDKYGLVHGSLVCEQDFPKVVNAVTSLSNRTSHKVC